MDHASMSNIAPEDIRQHGSLGAGVKAKAPPVCPTDSEAVTPRRKTQTLDYVWRSGVAGGLAGCTVSTTPSKPLRAQC